MLFAKLRESFNIYLSILSTYIKHASMYNYSYYFYILILYTKGHAVLITPHKTLDKYLGLLGAQSPIESGLIKCLPDHMNAEIVNGKL